MRRQLTTAALLILGSAAVAAAQSNAGAPVTATIVAAQQLSVTGTTDFGAVPGYAHTETIDPVAPRPSQSTALFSVPVTPSTSMVLSFPCSADLTRNGGVEQMLFTPFIAIGDDSIEQSEAFPFKGCGDLSLSGGTESFMMHIWLGGDLAVADNQAAGAYAGTYPVTAFITGG